MKYLFFFVGDPELAYVFAVAFMIIAVLCVLAKQKARYAVLAAVSWLSYAVWEAHCQTQGYNIRVDLMLLIFPLLSVTFLGVASLFFNEQQE